MSNYQKPILFPAKTIHMVAIMIKSIREGGVSWWPSTNMADNTVSQNSGSRQNGNNAVAKAGNSTTDNGAEQQISTESQGSTGTVIDQQPTRMESFFAITKSLILRALVIYFITSFFRKAPTSPTTGNDTASSAASNIFQNGSKLDVFIYLSESKTYGNFKNPDELFWELNGIEYGDWYGGPNGDGSYTHSKIFIPSERLLANGSIYLHAYVVRHGKSPDPSSPNFAGHELAYGTVQVNKYKRQKYLKTHNLLTGETALTPEQLKIAEKKLGQIVSHWHPNITVNLVTDYTNWVRGTVSPPIDQHIHFLPDGTRYKPIIYMNDYWNLMRDYQPINSSVKTLELQVTFQPISLFRWQMYFSQNMRNKWTNIDMFGDSLGGDDEGDDSLKEALLETSPYLLGITAFVSILHSIFELLAFKNDIQFWNNRKSLEGLSVRSVFFNVFQSLIVLLYVLDNDTNTIVRISCFVGLGIEIWKINKVVDVRLDRENPILGSIPRIVFKDKGSYVESSTREYDTLAFKYLSWAIYPLLFGYGIYSLLYQEHKGWYSWVLSMLYGFLLTFGFIMMTPQLFINYKLKSVAHLPWRMMTYKALNTFIDDIFAFVIKMPTMYRLGCFRDDIVFFIFLYQKFIYKTDLTRINEFGFSAEMENEAKNQIQPNGDAQKKDN